MGAGQSGVTLARLRRRASLLAALRGYMAQQGVLEVDTPLLRPTCASDPLVPATPAGDAGFLQSSPEALMKCLLAEHGQAIYQLGHVYRHGESGRLHQPEFTMLEWYRPAWTMRQLMVEVVDVLRLAGTGVATTFDDSVDYSEVFGAATGVAPDASVSALQDAVRRAGIDFAGGALDDARVLRDLLFSQCVQPCLGDHSPVFVTGFLAADAAFARLDPEDASRALRFEVYWKGVELANGGEELVDPVTWCARARSDAERRRNVGLVVPRLDSDWQAALESGLPPCAGVALGVDRLLMLSDGATEITAVVPFATHAGSDAAFG